MTFAITGGNTNNAFAINATTGVVTVNNAAALNFEASPQFSLTVTATDNGSPALSGSATVTVNLTNVNEAPVVTPVTFSLAENTANGTAVGTVAATDQDAGQTRTFAITGGNTNNAFAINATTGVLTVNNAAALNFETTPVFSLTVTATDNGTPALAGSATVTVNLLNVNESPVVTPRAFTINENSNNGVVIGTISATDPDAGQSRTFAITGGNTNNAFAINATTGVLTVNNSAALNFETTPQFSLTITATDNGSPAKSGSATVTVNLQNVNEAPIVPTQSLAVKTKSKAGAVVGTVVSSDPDAGQTRTYSIVSGNGSASKPVFAINATTGVITVKTASSVASSGTFTLGIRVTDSGSPALSTTGTVTIYVNSTGTVPAGGSLAANAQSTSAASTSSPVTASIPLVVDTSKSAKNPPVTTATGTIQAYQALVLATKRKSTIQFIADWLKRRS
ncbi:MAG: cadherin repeat domain-containing protein [Candidatus Saccharimonas sp.]|nr:cadherin repeat domain-containing protein [Planctomycetaceae bacterium]